MNENPRISVVMSVYNGQDYLREAVESILCQSYRDFEFIVVDDGSVDRTSEILAEYKDRRLRIVHQENRGLTPSLNRGIRLARGEYIARQDADDISMPERLEILVEILEGEPEVGLVGSHVIFIDRYGTEFSRWRTPLEHEEICRESKKYNPLCQGGGIFRKSCLEEIGAYREKFRYAQDYDLLLRMAKRFQVRNVDRFLYKWRKASHTISRKRLSQQLEYHLLVQKFSDEIAERGCDSYEQYTGSSPSAFLRTHFGVRREELNRFKAVHYLSYSEQALQSNDIPAHVRLVGRAFLYSPGTVGWKKLLRAFSYLA
jgi:glycosyltransferase involved in cell wall biosynthesis